MGEQAKVVELWPHPETVAERWTAARLHITLQLTYGRRRARMLARAAERA